MEYNTDRPTKRARTQNVLFQPDLPRLVPEHQPDSAQVTTSRVHHQERVPTVNALYNYQAPGTSNVINVEHQAPSASSSPWTVSTAQHNGWGGGVIENTPEIHPNVNEYQNFRPAPILSQERVSYLPLQHSWSSTLLDGYEYTPQQNAPQFGIWPSRPTGNSAAFSPQSAVLSDNYCQVNTHSASVYIQNSNLTTRWTVPEVNIEKICFGMIHELSGRCDVKDLAILDDVSVKFESSERFKSLDSENITGRLHSSYSQMIHGLLQEDTLELFVSCYTNKKPSALKQTSRFISLPCILEVTIYGPVELLEEIGDWFQEQDIYLQDPRSCHLDVRYCNPHKLSTGRIESCPLLSEVTTKEARPMEMQTISAGSGFSDALKSRDNLCEAHQPTAISSIMKKHQKQALTFMMQRERGWAFDQEYIDIWEAHTTDHGVYFVNRVSNACQDEEPAEFRGGIIADTMGLGKTLTMIALVAADLDASTGCHAQVECHHPDVRRVKGTLIIIPPPLLDTWEEQMAEHVFQDRLMWYRYHGKNRTISFEELHSQNIILTTYHTVSADWKAFKNGQSSLLFSVEWKRVILDEAHFIRNANSTMARAVCSLSASSRWAVSGTPVQNRLSDLASLLKFIQANPYNDTKQFETDISSLWKSGEDEEAIKRLQYLSACLILRRSRGTINLPPRKDLLCPVDFLPDERESYEALKQQAILSIDEAVSGQHERLRPGVYANALQRIESLRIFCDLGLQYHARHEAPGDDNWSIIAQRTFNSKRGIDPIFCLHCSLSLDFIESLLDEPDFINSEPQFSSCMKFFCRDCIRKLNQDNRIADCGHKPTCAVASVSTSGEVFEETLATLSRAPSVSTRLSSKVEALVTDLKRIPRHTKCIVFSTWRLTLDLVKVGLDRSSIKSIRFDGKVPQNERGAIIDRFRTDPEIRVMLLTLSCGAVGLTLTTASRAYLIEPHWNPTLEEQALARIHRLGQTKEVTTVRFYIRESFEEQVIKIQESKKQLANVLLSSHEGALADESMATLQALRSLL
ncbi:SNF2 family N-terminal domain-containing protein [Xylaria cubensis]|nr:SNF2 family N-terminal domain-containing protein [Xylaria cubensis]